MSELYTTPRPSSRTSQTLEATGVAADTDPFLSRSSSSKSSAYSKYIFVPDRDLSSPVDQQSFNNYRSNAKTKPNTNYNSYNYNNYPVMNTNNNRNFQQNVRGMRDFHRQSIHTTTTNTSDHNNEPGYKLTNKSVAQLINDLSYLKKLEDPDKVKTVNPNVSFNFVSSEEENSSVEPRTIKIHSIIMLARSNWFRRSWKKLKNERSRAMYNEENSEFSEFDFNFNYREKLNSFNLKISQVDSDVEKKLISEKFEFNIETKNGKTELLYKAFKELKKFLYTAECVINDENAPFLIGLASALDIESLRDYTTEYYKPKLSSDSFDDLFERLEISHVYKLSELKAECIKIINRYPKQVIDSVPWKKISENYPDLVLEIFYENAD